MKVKTKITLGLVFLFSVIVILSIISIHYLNVLTVQNQEVLQDNYRSLDYANGLEQSLDKIRSAFEPTEDSRVSLNKLDYRLNPAIASFESYLLKEQNNIQVKGEENLVNSIETDFEALKRFIKITRTKDYYFEKLLPLIEDINGKINMVYELNQQTIQYRNEMARTTANTVIYTVAGIVSFCILVAFSFMVGFPRIVAEPVDKLTEAIERIKKGDYSTRVEIKSNDEFGTLGATFNEMVTRLEEYEKLNFNKVMIEKKRIETMIRKISEGIIGLDSDFNILFINPFAKQVLGLKNQKILRKSAKDISLNNPLLQAVIDDIIAASIDGDRFTRNKLVKGNLGDKPAFFIRKVIITYGEDEGEKDLNGYIIMLKNITEFKELDQARTNFIATVSHELKTPISSIRMGIKLLRDTRLGELTTDQKEMVDDIDWEVTRLLNITQELLNATELESGKIQLHAERTNLHEIIEEAVDSIITLADDRQITITEKLTPDIPDLYLDSDKLIWVIINLLTNAIKYSPVNSEVHIEGFVKNETLHIQVTDQGTGVPESERRKIFERYYRIPGSEGKGTGLGLNISKEIVEQMNGEIGVRSADGQGSVFYVNLFDPFFKENKA